MRQDACLALDIGGTNLRMALISKKGTILKRYQSDCRILEGLAGFLDAISSGYDTLLGEAKASEVRIVAAGAGIPGLTDNAGMVISSVNLKPLNGFNLRKWLSELIQLPVTLLNDANAAGIAEHAFGAGRPFGSLLHVTLGTGVGSALILDNRLWTGIDGVASELGHTTVEPYGDQCSCGNHGCLEMYSSATAILAKALKGVENGYESSLSSIRRETLVSAHIYAAAINGDQLSIECMDSAGRYLGIASASIVNLLNLEAIILGGGVSEGFDLLAPTLRKEIDLRAFSLPAARVKVLKSELGDNAGIIGAAVAAWDLAEKR